MDKKEFGRELSKRPKVFREHVLAGAKLGILKTPVNIKNDKERNKHDMEGSWNRIKKMAKKMANKKEK